MTDWRIESEPGPDGIRLRVAETHKSLLGKLLARIMHEGWRA